MPHVYAKNEHDLYLVTGYLHAQDRLWQMDLLRRVPAGRLSEMFGADLIVADQLFRALRFDQKSKEMLESMSDELKQCLDAYGEGVNIFINQNTNNLPFEFAVLGYQPEPWLPEHSANLLGYFTWGLTHPWNTELTLFEIAGALGNEKMMELMPDQDLQTPIFVHYGSQGELVFENNLLYGSRPAQELGIEIFTGSNTSNVISIVSGISPNII